MELAAKEVIITKNTTEICPSQKYNKINKVKINE